MLLVIWAQCAAPPPREVLVPCHLSLSDAPGVAMGNDPAVALVAHFAAWHVIAVVGTDGTVERRESDARGWPILARRSDPPALAEAVRYLEQVVGSAPSCPSFGTDGATGDGIGFLWRRPNGAIGDLYYPSRYIDAAARTEQLPDPLPALLVPGGTPLEPGEIDVVAFRTSFPAGRGPACEGPSVAELDVSGVVRLPRERLDALLPEGCVRSPGLTTRIGVYPRSTHQGVVQSFDPWPVPPLTPEP